MIRGSSVWELIGWLHLYYTLPRTVTCFHIIHPYMYHRKGSKNTFKCTLINCKCNTLFTMSDIDNETNFNHASLATFCSYKRFGTAMSSNGDETYIPIIIWLCSQMRQ